MTRTYRNLILTAAIAMIGGIASAQQQTGTPPFGSFGGGPDVINLANLNSHIRVPVLQKAGRGLPFTYEVSYDSLVWYKITSGGVTSWQPAQNWGWHSQTEAETGYTSAASTQTGTCFVNNHPIPGQFTVSSWIYHDAFGISHSFAGSAILNTGSCPAYGGPNSTGFISTTTDGSGYKLTVTGSSTSTTITETVVSRDGTIETGPYNSGSGTGSGIDRNGNQISVNSSGVFTDTLGTTALTVAGTAPSNTTFTYTAPSGAATAVTMKYMPYTVETKFNCAGVNEYGATANVSLVSEIDLPDGSKYTFTYEGTPGVSGHVTGRLATVRVPTGGTITYGYSGGSNGITCSDGSTATLTRTIPDGTWTYARTLVTGTQWQTVITAPPLSYDQGVANQTVLQFQGIYETQRQIYQGSTGGTLLSTVNTCYNGAASPCNTTSIILPITQRTVIATVPGGGNLKSQHTDKFSAYGMPIETDDYDFWTGSTFPLLRQTLITYASLGSNLNAFTQSVIVKDGGGVIKSREDTTYDDYTSGLTCITGAPQHNDTDYGCSFTSRANPTSITDYTNPSTASGALTKNFTYDSFGNLRTSQLNCCQVETINYSLTTKYAFPESIITGSSSPTLTTAATYDLNMGLVLSITDPDNIQRIFTYDNMGRPLTYKDGTNPSTNFTYSDFDNSISFSSWSTKACMPVQGSNLACQQTMLDSFGRLITTQLLDGSGTVYSASDTQYDVLGRRYKESNPYSGSAAYWSQTNFDALGRPIKTTLPDNSMSTIVYTDNAALLTDAANKQRKNISDGLGRLTSVYEPDPSSGNTLTLQTSYIYNVLDELTQVTQGVQTRSYVYDALGRLAVLLRLRMASFA